MVIPAAMHIEAAAEMLRNIPGMVRDDQLRELAAFGEERLKEMGASGLTEDVKYGFELGLQTARVWLAGNPAYTKAKVDF